MSYSRPSRIAPSAMRMSLMSSTLNTSARMASPPGNTGRRSSVIGSSFSSRARSRNACLRCARRSALVPTTRTLSARMSRSRWPKRSRQASARAATSLSMRPFSATPAARRTISRRRSMMMSWPCEWRATTMWKLLLPRSTAARTSGTGRGAMRTLERNSASRAVTAGPTRDAAGSGGEGRAAATGGGRVRVADHELRTIEPLAVVDLGTAEVLHAHRIHQQLHAQVLDTGVAVLDLLVELEAVLQPRAAATLHEHAQHELRVALATDQVPDLAGRGIGEQERRRLLQCFGRTHCLDTHEASLEAARDAVKAALHIPAQPTCPCPAGGACGPRRTSLPMIWAPRVISMTP